jgi:hypothetical protein
MSSKRPLYILAAVCLAPFMASFALYFFWTPSVGQVNYGTLVAPLPLPTTRLRTPAGESFGFSDLRGKWVLLTVDAVACDQACARKLYATRQARTMTGKERERLQRLWLVTGDGAPPPELLAAHPDLRIAVADSVLLAALPVGPEGGIFLIDPLGNLILHYPADPDIKKLNQDIGRLLYASRIG